MYNPDIGMKVKCPRCLQEFNMWKATHSGRDQMVGGMCPNCNNYCTARIEGDGFMLYVAPTEYSPGSSELTEFIPYES
jgi:hypothetical protein